MPGTPCWRTGGKYLQAACRYLGWVQQGEAMTFAGSWRNVDMNDLEVIQRAGAPPGSATCPG
jgi:hypothetical protein